MWGYGIFKDLSSCNLAGFVREILFSGFNFNFNFVSLVLFS